MPFEPEDILIVGDGNCVSACTTSVNFMTNVGGVQSLVFGGRPRKEPMQIMGGVRGAQSAGFTLIENLVKLAHTAVRDVDESDLPDGFMATINETRPLPLTDFPLQIAGLNVNLRNSYQDDNIDLPLQFEYQAADCKLYYTYDNIVDPTTACASAKGAIWGNDGCVYDSTGGRGSKEDRESGDDDSQGGGEEGGEGGEGASAASLLKTGGSLLALVVSFAIIAVS